MIGSFMTRKKWLLVGAGAAVSLAAIACGTDTRGAAAPGTETPGPDDSALPPASGSIQSGYDAVRQSLQAEGAVVVRGEEVKEGIFKNPYTEVFVNGQPVQLYEFQGAGGALEASLDVSPDGTTVSNEGESPVVIDFQNKPHYFLQGNVIVVYTGDDAATLQLLRDRLGKEFAGDTSVSSDGGNVTPTEPGKGGTEGQPDYETVSVPAPIEGVKVGTAPDDPNSYVLYVTSGLPGGCASFEDWSLERADDGTFVLKLTNLVPAPDEMVACTMIYGMVDHVIPVGTVGKELTACEVYTVSFEAGEEAHSVRFQAISDNVRCADPGLDENAGSYGTTGVTDPGRPNDGGGDIPQSIISDVQALLYSLQSLGIDAHWATGDERGSALLGFDSDVIYVNGQRVDVWAFAPGSSAWEAAGGISQDGYSVNVPGAPQAEVMWIDAPHFYLHGNAIVLYVGNDESVLKALGQVGTNFAGPGSQPLDTPIPVEPDGGIGDGAGTPVDPVKGGDTPAVDLPAVLVPAPIVSVGEVAASKSLPPQYFISVRTAQPDGCHKDAGYEVKVDGTKVYVTMNNSVPGMPLTMMCTMIYGETDHSVKLGTGEDFQTGVEYTVIVNGEVERTFTGL